MSHRSIPDPSDGACVADFVRRAGAGVVATVDAQGRPEAAFVGLAATEGVLIFDASAESRKVRNIGAGAPVAVVVGEGEVSLQLEGHARPVSGEERERWGREYERQHPGSRALHDGFAVVVVDIGWVRVYDARRSPATVVEATIPARG